MYDHIGFVKKVGHFLKRCLPSELFKCVLAAYHWCVGELARPKACFAMRKVGRTVVRIRNQDSPIRFGFYVVLESMFQMRRVYELMLKDPRFKPFIVVVPRIGWEHGDMVATLEKTYASLVKDFGSDRVFKGYHDGVYENHIEECDACTMMNVYRNLADSRFETEYFARHGVPIFAAPYFYHNGTIHTPEYYGMSSLKYVRKFFAANKEEIGYFKQYQRERPGSDRVELTGSAKTDAIVWGGLTEAGGKKVVLIAPHHSVIPCVDDGFRIGNFLRYKDFFKSLPRRYPDVHWIFRPHPHLRVNLIKNCNWTQADWDLYVADFEASPNAEYEAVGTYYDSFERSSAIVQDCGSFLPEYYFTGKPCCYMLDSPAAKDAQFNEWGMELLAHVYQAYDEQAIIRFIEDTVIGGKDAMKEDRQRFAKERVMINYPNASETILESIADFLGHGKRLAK